MDRASLRVESPSLIGTALYGAVRRVVWDPWLALVSHGDPIRRIHFDLEGQHLALIQAPILSSQIKPNREFR